MVRWLLGCFIGISFVIAGGVALAHNPNPIILGPGESRNLSCLSGCVGQINGNSAFVAGATLIPIATSTPTASPTTTATPSGHPNHWHAPSTREHGDDLSVTMKAKIAATCAIPSQVVLPPDVCAVGGFTFGGDERSSDMENTMKHAGFKVAVMPLVIGGGAELAVRYHAATNPPDRQSRYHSLEAIWLDRAGNLSFLQGWMDCGDPNEPNKRVPMSMRTAGDTLRPNLFLMDQNELQNGTRAELWYCNMVGFPFDFTLNISNATTVWSTTEGQTDFMNQATWVLNTTPGDSVGLYRNGGFFLYRYPWTPWGSFCMIPISGPAPCGTPGALPQYMAETLWLDVVNSRVEGNFERTYVCPQCVVPN